jgi:hypothetical protein
LLRYFNKFVKEEKGNTLILAAISLVVLLGIAGLAIDGSLIYMTKSQLQKAANAAVLSGAQDLPFTEQKVTDTVQYILNAHNENTSSPVLDIDLGNKVGLDLTREVNLTFASIFGFEKMDVKVHAAAGLFPIGKAFGAVPLGVDDSKPLVYFQEYQLKVGPSDSEYGNFGILALERPGAKTYEENLRAGYQGEVKIGEIINTQTGNIAGKTRDVIQERVNGCTQPPGDYSMRECSRIILVLVYKPYAYDGGQMKQVQVTGFAYFYIKAPMNSNDTSITGVFIKRAGTGTFVEGSLNKGAYTTRLME